MELIEQAAQVHSSAPGDLAGPAEEVARLRGRIVELGDTIIGGRSRPG
ncbi:hypothetical protein [Streptomyces sp. NPDC002187]